MYLAALEWVAAVKVVLQLGDPSEEAAALEYIFLEACEALSLAHQLWAHNPHQDSKVFAPWFDTSCCVTWCTLCKVTLNLECQVAALNILE